MKGILNHLRGTADSNYLSPKDARIGLFTAILVYSVFSVVDWFMLPEHYKLAWTIRFTILIPGLISFIYLSYKKEFFKNIKKWLTFLIVTGQLGICLIIYIANPNELAYFEYYVGLVLVIMWATFVFRLTFIQMIFVSFTNLLFYNSIIVLIEKFPFHGIHSNEFAFFINNNFILIASSFLATIGSILINRFNNQLNLQNQILENEKKALKSAKLKAEESDRLKSAFLSNMSHEIRTPMNAIIGFTEMLRKPNLPDTKKDNYIEIIQTKGKHLLQLINDIIDISRIEANALLINFAETNINNIIDDLELLCISELQVLHKEKDVKVVIEKSLPDEKSIINTDHFRLRQILSNLINNACKFTDKGFITIGYKIIDQDKIQLYVKDTGIGIPQDKQDWIFDRFRQIEDENNRSYGGTGLGLNIVKNLTRLLKGKLIFETELNKGSHFILEFPYFYEEKKIKEENINKEEPDLKENHQNTKILIVEDDNENYLLLHEIFENLKFETKRAKNGVEALEILNSEMNPDIILLDIKMPKMNGFETITKIREINATIPIIAHTAYAMIEDLEKMKGAGFDDIITKPVDINRLMGIIRKYQ